MRTVVCYISGHGFGHAVRVLEVLRALWQHRPDLAVLVRTPVARRFFELDFHGSIAHGYCRLDVGAVQRNSLTLDEEATLRAYARLLDRRSILISGEVEDLDSMCPSLVFSDIPALAFEIAARLGVPSVGMTNFSWDWIYADYVRDFPAYADIVTEIRRSYGKATLLLRLPFHGDLSAFRHIRDIPLVARRAARTGADARARLSLPADQKLVLLSFGGIGIDLPNVLPTVPGVTFVATGAERTNGSSPPYRLVTNEELAATGVRYEELVAAADAVITKPGYGIVSDCIANGTPIIYTSRGRFAEYACLEAGIRASLPHAFITNEDLFAGRWRAAVDAVLSQPRPDPGADCGGAAAAAEILLEFLRR